MIGSLFSLIGCTRDRGHILIPDPISSPMEVDEPEVLKIGFMVTGDRLTYPRGAEMAVAEINKQGGLLGKEVVLLTHINFDSKLDVSLATAENWIREDKIIALIGPNRSLRRSNAHKPLMLM